MTSMTTRTAGRAWGTLGFVCLLLPTVADVSLAFDEADVRAIVGNTRAGEANPGARGLWMGRQRSVEIDGMGNAVITEHLLARVLDPSWGRERFSPYRRIFWGEFTDLAVRARTWRSRTEPIDLPADSVRIGDALQGGAVDSYHNLRECRVSWPPLDQGEVVELVLTWTCPIPPHDRNVRWLEETFGAEDPVIEQQLVLITPSAMTVGTATLGPPLPARTSATEGRRTQTWITGNLRPVPAHFVETPWSRVPVPEDTVGTGVTRILLSTLSSWSFTGAYFGAQWEDSWNRRNSEIDRFVGTVIGKQENPRARALALEAGVRREYRTLPVSDLALGTWPPPAALVALEHAGGSRDLSLLLVSVLRAAGIEASPVLVRERRDRWDDGIPSLAQFDRWVVRARPAGSEPLWLDPTGSPRAIPPGRGLLLTGARDRPELQQEAGLVEFPGLPATRR
jgi:hypothetical protein